MQNLVEIWKGKTKQKDSKNIDRKKENPDFIEMFMDPNVRKEFVKKIEKIGELIVAKDRRAIELLREMNLSSPLKVLDSFIGILEEKNDLRRAGLLLLQGPNIKKLLDYKEEILALVKEPEKGEVIIEGEERKTEKREIA